MLEAFQAMADIGGLFRLALRVDEDRQIAGDAGGIHDVEEIGAVAAQQVLHIVLGGGEHDVDAGRVHQPVEAGVIEGNGEGFGRRGVDVHGLCSGWRCCIDERAA